jgi:hypothetical protein
MSDTPRTDAEWWYEDDCGGPVVPADFARTLERELTAARAEVEALRAALQDLLARDERETCQHEETNRGGAIWEICDGCGSMWADDKGGKPEWIDPPEWVKARAALTKEKAS